MTTPVESTPALRRDALLLIAAGAGTYAVLCAYVFCKTMALTQHHFVFSLDDPYIHFALARNIAHGLYGLNAGEPASPSSSLLWPYLLALFARSASLPRVAFAVNLLAGVGAACACAWSVAAWPQRDLLRQELLRRLLAVVALVVAGNLVGLTFLGMEHTLQVMLVAVCALGVIRCLQGRSIPMLSLLAAVIVPSVRYECLGVTLAIAFALYGQGLRKRATAVFLASLLPLVAFSAYLRHLRLPLLPLSVLVKARGASGNTGLARELMTRVIALVRSLGNQPDHLLLFVLFVTLASIAFSEPVRARRFALAGAAATAGLHLAIGKFNWFHRYEVYAVLFCLLILLYVLHERPRMLLGWFALGLVACTSVYQESLFLTPLAAQDVYLQQFQTHRFLSEYNAANIAVNDLGIVAFERAPGQYVFDLAGLGSAEAARQNDKSAAWLDTVMREHTIGAVAIYPDWFGTLPAQWTELGDACLARMPIVVPHACVHFYATGLTPTAALQKSFAAYAKTVPGGDIVHLASMR